MGRSIGENISKNISSKYSHNLLDHAKQSATDALETVSKKAIQKTAEETCDLIDNEIAEKFKKVSKTSPQKNSVINEEENTGLDREIHRERYVSPEQRQKIIDDLRLI